MVGTRFDTTHYKFIVYTFYHLVENPLLEKSVMKILHSHLQKNIVTMTGLVVLIMAGLESFIAFVGQLESIGTQDYGVLQAFVYVMLSLPHDVYPLFPAAVLVGSLIGLGRLASQSELIVMRAAGVSKAQMTVSVLRSAIIMLICAIIIGEWLGTELKDFANNYKNQAVTGKPPSANKWTIWIRDKDDFIFINKATPTGELTKIIRYQFDHGRLVSASFAKSAVYTNGHWIFKNISETIFSPERVIVRHYRQQEWPVSFNYKLLSLKNILPDQTSLVDLFHYIEHLKSVGLSASVYEFNFWKRIFQPFITLVMIGLAVPFIFGPLRSTTMGFRILIGVVIGFGFYTLNDFLGPFSLVYQVPPLWAATIPLILFALVDAILLWRVR